MHPASPRHPFEAKILRRHGFFQNIARVAVTWHRCPSFIGVASMSLRAWSFLAILFLPLPALAADAATQWWADISVLADDNMRGRMTGTADYLRAADYVIGRFKQESLAPAGSDGYLQPVPLEQ